MPFNRPLSFAGALLAASWSLAVMPADPAGEAFWPQWRGPYATGVSKRADPPAEWSETKNVRWKIEVPGRGSGSPVVWGDRVFVLSAVPKDVDAAAAHEPRGMTTPRLVHRYVVMAVGRKDGKVLWERTAREGAPSEGAHQDNGTFSSSSAVTDGQHVVASFESQGLYAYDMNGALVWSKDFGDKRMRNEFGEGQEAEIAEGRDRRHRRRLGNPAGRGGAQRNREQPRETQTGAGQAGQRHRRRIGDERGGDARCGQGAAPAGEPHRPQTLVEPVAEQAADPHGQRERGEAPGGGGLACPELVVEVHRGPVVHRPLRQQHAEGEDPDEQQRAPRQGEERPLRSGVGAPGQQKPAGDQHDQCSEGGGGHEVGLHPHAGAGHQTAQPGAGQGAERESGVQRGQDRAAQQALHREPVHVHGHVEQPVAEAHRRKRERERGKRRGQAHRYQAGGVAERADENQGAAAEAGHQRAGHGLADQETEHRAEQGESERPLPQARAVLDRREPREDRREHGPVEGEDDGDRDAGLPDGGHAPRG